MKNSMVVLKKIKHITTIWSSDSTSAYIPKRTQSRDLNWYLHTYVHCIIHNRKTQKQPKCPLADKWINKRWYIQIMEYCCCFSVAQSRLTLCNPMDCSTPGFPVLHHLPEFTQTHIRWINDAIQPSHPLSSPSPPAFNLSQHQGLFQWNITQT